LALIFLIDTIAGHSMAHSSATTSAATGGISYAKKSNDAAESATTSHAIAGMHHDSDDCADLFAVVPPSLQNDKATKQTQTERAAKAFDGVSSTPRFQESGTGCGGSNNSRMTSIDFACPVNGNTTAAIHGEPP
jgi:hypothetical protein